MKTNSENNGVEVIEDDVIQFCTFRLSSRLFGINILDVKEVNADKINFTQVFHANKAIRIYELKGANVSCY